ncbi:MAG: hypothetical protein IKW79_05480, partial [Schwartzia sp.]|nr:hypothetical protein [Schwartzia sp. (in: firmicutes)]
RPESYKNLRSMQSAIVTNDLVFDAMLGLMDVRLSKGYEPENDNTSSQYNTDASRFCTVYGKYSIADDPSLKQG